MFVAYLRRRGINRSTLNVNIGLILRRSDFSRLYSCWRLPVRYFSAGLSDQNA